MQATLWFIWMVTYFHMIIIHSSRLKDTILHECGRLICMVINLFLLVQSNYRSHSRSWRQILNDSYLYPMYSTMSMYKWMGIFFGWSKLMMMDVSCCCGWFDNWQLMKAKKRVRVDLSYLSSFNELLSSYCWALSPVVNETSRNYMTFIQSCGIS